MWTVSVLHNPSVFPSSWPCPTLDSKHLRISGGLQSRPDIASVEHLQRGAVMDVYHQARHTGLFLECIHRACHNHILCRCRPLSTAGDTSFPEHVRRASEMRYRADGHRQAHIRGVFYCVGWHSIAFYRTFGVQYCTYVYILLPLGLRVHDTNHYNSIPRGAGIIRRPRRPNGESRVNQERQTRAKRPAHTLQHA